MQFQGPADQFIVLLLGRRAAAPEACTKVTSLSCTEGHGQYVRVRMSPEKLQDATKNCMLSFSCVTFVRLAPLTLILDAHVAQCAC